METGKLLIGCVGWSIPFSQRDQLPGEGSHLKRYSRQLNAVEVDSSFYRPHRKSTYARWAATVEDSFRFSVQIPQEISHESRLCNTAHQLEEFLSECSCLGDKLGCLLLQLPPIAHYEPAIVSSFFDLLRRMTDVPVACEPRHVSWFTRDVDQRLADFGITRVVSDPNAFPVEGVQVSSRWNEIAYYRLHGTPRNYSTSHDKSYLTQLAYQLQRQLQARRTIWCIFDNTTLGTAIQEALELTSLSSQLH